MQIKWQWNTYISMECNTRLKWVKRFTTIFRRNMKPEISIQNRTYWIRKVFLTLNGWGEGVNLTPPPVVFRKIYLLKKEWSTGFLWLLIFFSEILFWKSHLFWNFHCNSQVVQKIWRISLQYYLFSSIFKNFWIFWHFLVTKKLMTSAYSSSCQHFSALKAL